MEISRRLRAVGLLLLSAVVITRAQSDPDLIAYKTFLAAHQDMSTQDLLALHPAGRFASSARTQASSAILFSRIDSVFHLTVDERSMLEWNGFVVTERVTSAAYADGFLRVYNADIPVFISCDGVLHAIHMSYDRILESVETQVSIPKIGDVLDRMQGTLPALAARYGANPEMIPSLTDLDLYLAVARRLLGKTVTPYYVSTIAAADEIIAKIEAATVVYGAHPLFADTSRWVDYSQFVLRGHYTRTAELGRYFRTMMWLGRTEFYLTAPEGTVSLYAIAKIQRQAIAALLVREAAGISAAESDLTQVDDILRFFVGDPDNVTLSQIGSVVAGMSGADVLLDTLAFRNFQNTLLENAWAYQRILSQILISGSPLVTDHIKPASAFLLMGQRFVIDSYVTGGVVFDKILYGNTKPFRPLPSAHDVLFALGNDASAQLLQPELDQFHYGTNLAALRYLVDSYEPQFWRKTIYNGWLQSIRALNPPAERGDLPSFMQTAAWWQHSMNTQLTSWAELRHDNLLYAKQSYTGGTTCSFPYGYVEPVPAFYRNVGALADTASAYFGRVGMTYIRDYFSGVKGVVDTLAGIAEKELARVPLDAVQEGFLKRALYSVNNGGCGGEVINGWYTRLYCYAKCTDADRVVADVHTCPTDASGSMVGWVKHVGTGYMNMAFLITELPGVGNVAFAGPVGSYYEHVTENFKRLTDEEWRKSYVGTVATRPSWSNNFLADASGRMRAAGPTLLTGIENGGEVVVVPEQISLGQNYPNPFNPTTAISYHLPALSGVEGSAISKAKLVVYDFLGREVAVLADGDRPPGTYVVRWDASGMASGVYFARLMSGTSVVTRKMVLVR